MRTYTRASSLVLATLPVVLALVGCGGDPACIAGESRACACTDGRTGAQVCRADETLGPCECAAPASDAGSETLDAGASEPDSGTSLDAAVAIDAARPVVCGDRRVEGDETCDDGNTITEVCAYGQAECTVCSAECREVAGATRVCGDGATEPREEDCDGEPYCDESCEFLGTAFEPNDTIDRATRLEAAADGTFSHPADMVYGPLLVTGGMTYFESPDVFQIEVCNGGTLEVRIDFTNADGNLDLLVGRRPQSGGSGGPPPVVYEWSSESIVNDFEMLSVAAPPVGALARTHYVRVEADSESSTPIRNRYVLSGRVVGCP